MDKIQEFHEVPKEVIGDFESCDEMDSDYWFVILSKFGVNI